MTSDGRYCGSCGYDRKDKKGMLQCPKCNSTWWTDDAKILRWTEE